jgi:dynein heavy chain, axonemal
MQHIADIPIMSTPGVFGLHANAEINYFTNASKEIAVGLLSMQTGEGGSGGGVSKEDYIDGLASDILKKIPDEDLKLLKEDTPTPNEVVLLQEIERFDKLTVTM